MPETITAVETAARREDAGATPLFTLVETIEDLSNAHTVDQIAAVVRTAARRITGADGVAFVLRDGDHCHYLDEDAIGPLWKGRRFPMSACISGRSMLTGETAVVPDIYKDDRIPHDAYRPTFVKSLVITPVRPRDPIAAIGAYWASERTPSAEEVVKLQVMARATATALENARMYASLNETLDRGKFLLNELDHRCKNMLAAVQSVANQTLRQAASPDDFVEAFNGRLAAMAVAHEMLTRQSWGRAQLSEIIREALGVYGGLDDGRITAAGPPITLSAESAVAMHMTLHELAVNANKYGALSSETGRVSIGWSVDMAASQRELELVWREQGGPKVRQPEKAGFGSRLIQRGIARDLGGEGNLQFEPDGVVFTLRAPLSDRLALA